MGRLTRKTVESDSARTFTSPPYWTALRSRLLTTCRNMSGSVTSPVPPKTSVWIRPASREPPSSMMSTSSCTMSATFTAERLGWNSRESKRESVRSASTNRRTVDVHSPGIPVERVVPHLLQEPPAGKSHAIVWHQVVKQVKLPRCQIDLTPLHSQHACFPRHQLPRVERLGHQDHQGRPLLFYQTHRSLSSYCANKI